MRIGVWCDYGFTLEPSEGIGVFVHNLVRGMVRADAGCEILLMANPKDAHLVDSTVETGEGRIRVAKTPNPNIVSRFCIKRMKRMRRQLDAPQPDQGWRYQLDQSLGRCIAMLNARTQARIDHHVNACDVWLIPYVALDQTICRPYVVAIHDLVSYHFPDMLPPHKLNALKRRVTAITSGATLAACMSNFIRDHDLIQTLGLPMHRIRVIKPAVPEDLLTAPTESDAEAAEGIALALTVNSSSPSPAADASDLNRSGSNAGSNTTGSNATGTLSSATISSRAIASAVSATLASLLPERAVGCPYLFYPAAFRAYKNHRLLIEALALLRRRTSVDWKVVLTGIRHCPSHLRQLMHEHQVSDHVHILRKVSRAELTMLYRGAFATVVPSLYEQGSFPVLEALACQCPAAAADIPSLREQFEAMGQSMLFFDPHSSVALANMVEHIGREREAIIAAQQHGFATLRQYTWETSAKRWLAVFREAAVLGDRIDKEWPSARVA